MALEYLRRAPSGMSGAHKFLFQENDRKLMARFRVGEYPVVLKAYALAENQCLCIEQVHATCCGEDIVSDHLTCCEQHCLTCCDNQLIVATPGDYAITLDEPNVEAVVTITEIKSKYLNFEVKEWL